MRVFFAADDDGQAAWNGNQDKPKAGKAALMKDFQQE